MPLALLPTQRCCSASACHSLSRARVFSSSFRTLPVGFEVAPTPKDQSRDASTTQIPAGGGLSQSQALRGVRGRGAAAQVSPAPQRTYLLVAKRPQTCAAPRALLLSFCPKEGWPKQATPVDAVAVHRAAADVTRDRNPAPVATRNLEPPRRRRAPPRCPPPTSRPRTRATATKKYLNR